MSRLSSRSLRRSAAFTALLGLTGCSDHKATALVIAFSAEPGVQSVVKEVTISATRSGSATPSFEQQYQLPQDGSLPGTLTFSKIEDAPDSESVLYRIDGLDEKGHSRISRQARLGFIKEHTKLLRMPLEQACLDHAPCPSNQTCTNGVCISDVVDPGGLPDFVSNGETFASGGAAGASGDAGTAGIAGSGGDSGTAGVGGTGGAAGTSGVAGTAGNAGTSGASGSGGVAGTSGVAGTAGNAGSGGVPMGVCGDGQATGNEQCDDGNTIPGDGCGATCDVEMGFICAGSPSVCSFCGDLAITGGEQCDDGNNTGGDGCSATCQKEPGFACVDVGSPCVICGNGNHIVGGKECDDGNTTPGDGCNEFCEIEPGYVCLGTPSTCGKCGDGTVTAEVGEVCDHGATNGDLVDGCSATCQLSSLVTWLDGSDPNGDGSLPADNDLVSTWVDKAQGINATQTVPGMTPAYMNSVVGNHGGLVFGGNNDFYALSQDINRSTRPDITVVAVIINEASTNTYVGLWGDDNDAYDRFLSVGGSAMYGVSDGAEIIAVGAGIMDVGTPLVTVTSLSVGASNTSYVYVNGKVSATFNEVMGDMGGATMSIGSIRDPLSFSAAYQFHGKYLEFMLFDRTLSPAELVALNKILASKYGTSYCGNGIVDPGETCDDGVNNGSFCDDTCLITTPLEANILDDCVVTASTANSYSGVGCNNLNAPTKAQASWVNFASGTTAVDIYEGPDCTGNSLSLTTDDTNLCTTSFPQDSMSARHNIGSIRIQPD